MEFTILGPTTLHVQGERIPLGAAKQRAMLAFLLYYAGTAVPVDELVDQLWDGRGVDECRPSLYALASRIRTVLSRVGARDALVRIPGMGAYRLDIDHSCVDFHRFRGIVGRAREAIRKGQDDAARTMLTTAIGLWRDEPLADLRGARSEHLRRSMKDAFVDARKLLAENQLRCGEYDAVLTGLEPLLRANELDETIAQQWISALHASGRRDDARTFLHSFRRRFRAEMRVEPSVTLPDPVPDRQSALARPGIGAPCQLLPGIVDFVGHHALLERLEALARPETRRANAVVISGMPGIGKTTIATEFAHRHKHQFPDGQLYLDAGGFGPNPPVGPFEALGHLLRALDVPADRIPASSQQRRDRFNQLVNGRRLLIVLDNVPDSSHARALIPAADGCVTVITSRRRLSGLTIRDGVPGVVLPPLPDAECRVLLRHMILAARADADEPALAALARLSHGLPLALRIIGEHVAERPRVPIADLVDELSRHLLDEDVHDEVDGVLGLRTAFTWSFNALPVESARLFRVLGLFPGANVSPEAAAALRGISTTAAEQLLNGLAKAHLVSHDALRRYKLHDLLRQYAAERARQEESTVEVNAAVRRCLDWYLLTAVNAAALLAPYRPSVPDLPEAVNIQPQTFATEAEAMRWCEAERGNIGLMTHWAAEHGLHRHAWQLPNTVHEVFERYGTQADLRELLELALSSARVDGHTIGQIASLNNVSVVYLAQHDDRRAKGALERALKLSQDSGYVDGELACSHNLALVSLRFGDAVTAVDIYLRVLARCQETDRPAATAYILHRLGMVSFTAGNFDAALNYFARALSIRERIGSARGQGMTHSQMATVYLAAGKYDFALEHGGRAMAIHDRTKDEVTRCETLTVLADVQRLMGRHREAQRAAHAAAMISDEMGDSRHKVQALAVLADALHALQAIDAARRVCTDALRIVDELADPEMRTVRERLIATARSLGTHSQSGTRPLVAYAP